MREEQNVVHRDALPAVHVFSGGIMQRKPATFTPSPHFKFNACTSHTVANVRHALPVLSGCESDGRYLLHALSCSSVDTAPPHCEGPANCSNGVK